MKKKKVHIISGIVFAILFIVVGACAIYLNDYYITDIDAVNSYLNQEPSYEYEDGAIVFEPEEATAGFIFYPGGKVEYTAYLPLMQACAEQGMVCVLVEMPFNLAVFDVNAADGIREKYPQVTDWYIGGHSLGGSMAAAYLTEHAEAYEGLVLLGSYSTEDLSDTELQVISIYGSEDKVLNKENYATNKENLPANFAEHIIDGGCHAYFGMYGPQEGDGEPTLTVEEQISLTAEYIGTSIIKKTP